MWLASLYTIVFNFARVNGAGTDNIFVWPVLAVPYDIFVGNLLWPLGSKQTVEWSTTLDSYSIALYHESVDPHLSTLLRIIYSMRIGKYFNVRSC